MSDFSVNFKRLRKQKGLTQAQVAEYLGVNKSTISNYESGYSEPGSHEKLERVADFYGVSIDELLGKTQLTIADPQKPTPTLVEIPILPIDPDVGRTKITLPHNIVGEGDFLAFHITDDTLNHSSLVRGDLVFCLRQDVVDDGELALVLIDQVEHKLCYLHADEETISLTSLEDDTPTVYPKEQVYILGKVLKKLSEI